MKFCGIKINGTALLCGGLLLSSVSSFPITGLAFAAVTLGAGAVKYALDKKVLDENSQAQEYESKYIFFVDDTQKHLGGAFLAVAGDSAKLTNPVTETVNKIHSAVAAAVKQARADNKTCEIIIATRSGAEGKTFYFPKNNDHPSDLRDIQNYIDGKFACSSYSICPDVIAKSAEDTEGFKKALFSYIKGLPMNVINYKVCTFAESPESYYSRDRQKLHSQALHSECNQFTFNDQTIVEVAGHVVYQASSEWIPQLGNADCS